ncbi:hypothetical protein GCM10009677_08730 [Sphaerisporangium rubeum]|uniref:Uncharacterized protein n=1 Tax=Sphaerisporangium rubeum TaxID=321317 RepID=A0A7X0IKH4_9ACTN|nr:hypothetical protein [Sphaerisporangium rubeum]MBB6476620.1 hypothetical protein [Sphaerisporangium rubeum]
MPHTNPYPDPALQEVTNRNRNARQLITAFSSSTLALAEIWQHVTTALDDTLTLVTQLTKLQAELSRIRRQRADMVAAARATLAAHHDGEADPLFYLRDELTAQRADEAWPGERG